MTECAKHACARNHEEDDFIFGKMEDPRRAFVALRRNGSCHQTGPHCSKRSRYLCHPGRYNLYTLDQNGRVCNLYHLEDAKPCNKPQAPPLVQNCFRGRLDTMIP